MIVPKHNKNSKLGNSIRIVIFFKIYSLNSNLFIKIVGSIKIENNAGIMPRLIISKIETNIENKK